MYKFSARFFDGMNIQSNIILVEVLPEALSLTQNDKVINWPKESLQLMERPFANKPAVIGCKTMLGARLIVENQEAIDAILPLIAKKNIKLSHVHHPWRIAWMLILAAMIVIFLPIWQFRTISSWIAAAIPYSWEEDIWNNEIKPRFEGTTQCVSEDGVKALDKIVNRLSKQTKSKHKFDIRVIDSPDFVNAESTPGFHIFIYSGLFKIDSPDAIAGVIAHEMGHSLEHHVIASFINEMGVKAFYHAVLGVSDKNIAFDFLNLKFSRDYELEADKIAIDLVQKANIDTNGFKQAMQYLAQESTEYQGLEAYLVDHPPHEDRIDLVNQSEKLKNPEPALTPAEWQSLKNICSKTKPMSF